LQCYVLRMRVMTSTVGGNLTNRPPALRHIHVNTEREPDNCAAAQVVIVESQTTQRSLTKVFVLHHRIHSCHVEKCFKSLLPVTPTNRRLGEG